MENYINSIKAFKNDCIAEAKKLGDYQSMSIDDLANGYCEALDNNDEVNMNRYISALMLKFWYTIAKMNKACELANYGDLEDFITIVYERIEYACKYRAWQKPDSKTNAQACINMSIATGIKNINWLHNLDKYKLNSLLISLDTPLDSSDSDSDTVGTNVEDESENPSKIFVGSGAASFIQDFINNNNIVEAIILDTIAFNDTTRTFSSKKTCEVDGEKYSYKEYATQFWSYRTVQFLNSLPLDYRKYFTTKYSVAAEPFDAALEAISKASNQKKYRYINKTLSKCKANVNMLLG